MKEISRGVATAAAALLLILTGCTGPASKATPAATTSLGGADVAVYITEFVNGRTPSGRVVLYDRAGPVSMVGHQGIEGNGLVWDQAGLFFIDQTHDFQVNDTTVDQHRRSRDAGTVLGMAGDGQGRRVVLFNDGLASGHNHTGVGLYDGAKEQSQQDLLDSTAYAIAYCGKGFYLAGPTIEIVTESALIRLDPSHNGNPQLVGQRVPGEFLDDRMGAPCRSGAVIGLWTPFRNGPTSSIPMEIWQWDTNNGVIARAPLKSTTGAFRIDPRATSSAMPRWLDGDDLLWVDATGVGWRTNLDSGLTRKVRDGMIAYRGPIDAWTLAGDYLIGFEYLADNTAGRLQIYSAHSMELLQSRDLPLLADVTPKGQQVLAVAVRPGFAPSA